MGFFWCRFWSTHFSCMDWKPLGWQIAWKEDLSMYHIKLFFWWSNFCFFQDHFHFTKYTVCNIISGTICHWKIFKLQNMSDANKKVAYLPNISEILWLAKTKLWINNIINSWVIMFWILVIFKILQPLHVRVKQVFNRITCNSNRSVAKMMESALKCEF